MCKTYFVQNVESFLGLRFFKKVLQSRIFKDAIEYAIKMLTIFYYDSHFGHSTQEGFRGPFGLTRYPGTLAGIGLKVPQEFKLKNPLSYF